MKRLIMLAIVLVLAATAIHAEDTPNAGTMQCRDLVETNNVVGPDETIVNGRVCKVLKMTESQVGTSESLVRSKTSQASNQRKPRVFVTESDSWAMSGGWSESGGKGSGHIRGGARPQTAEIIKTFGERCPAIVVNNNKERADFVVILDHEGGKGVARKRNKIAVFSRSGDSIFSDSTRSLGNSVKDSCSAIVIDFQRNPPEPASVSARAADQSPTASAAAPAQPAAPPASPSASAREEFASLTVKSTPDGADIMMDGKFVGSTPSTLKLPSGDHNVSVGAVGFKNWQRSMPLSSGSSVTVNATLEKVQ